MRKACLKNLRAAGALQGSHDSGKGILLFYSAECGLKYLIMSNRGQRTTKEVAAEFGHNISRLIGEARIARSELSQPGNGTVTMPAIHKAGAHDTIVPLQRL